MVTTFETIDFEIQVVILCKNMKYTSFFLVLVVILCRIGLDEDVYHSDTLSNITNSHINHQDEISCTEAIVNSYKYTESAEHNTCMCEHALPNAPLGHDINLRDIIAYSVAVNMSTLEINSVPSFALSLKIKERNPPDLFLANSSFLL